MRRCTTRAALAALALCGALAAPSSAQLAPYHQWRTLDTPHFRVHVRAGLEREGRVAGAAAEKAYAQLSRELVAPRGPIDLVVADDADYSNGSATPFPTNRIIVYATPPIESEALRFNEDWLSLVITHELTHIFHLDRSRGAWRIAQRVFGRAPALFPNLYGPSWLTEGLAVYYESRLTEGGRLKDSEHRLLAQTSALEHALPRLNELSLGTPLFPGGERAYSFGSLLVDYLGATRGDSAIRRFVETQSASLIPFRMNHDAKTAFGISFEDAFDAWRDSMQTSVGAVRPPLAGWRELTTHGYYAQDPRWLSDSLLAYSANDGRSTTAQYALSLEGTRRRIGRRNNLGASVPMEGGGLLFAQLDFTTPNELRSDLYLERDGVQRQLTHDLRLVQPDVSRDGVIVAAQYDATRVRLVLLDRSGKPIRVLRDAERDETWSEPRWSPDASRLAVSHRQHGGIFSLEIIDLATDSATILDRGRYLISTPSWSPDGRVVVYTSEESGTPILARRLATARSIGAPASVAPSASENILTPELSPSGRLLAAGTLRADGYHVGVAPSPALDLPHDGAAVASDTSTAAANEQPLAPGEFHAYSAWRTALPQYWYPTIEAAPGRGTRLGFTTSGYDVLGRHLYNLDAAVPTTGSYPTADFAYRYAGFRKPYLDVALYQDFTAERTFVNGGTGDTVGTLLRRTRDASLATTWVRQRVRTYSSFSLGVGLEHRDFVSDPGQFLVQQDPAYARSYVYPRFVVGGQWSNTQRPSLSISPEDGLGVAFTARERFRADSAQATGSASVVATAAGYKSLDLPGFAHHVLALRAAGGFADRRTATALEVGGVSGNTIQIVPGYLVGEGRRTFGVRGFESASVYGTRAVAGSLEYRAPFSLGGYGLGELPFFFDRSSLSAFVDAGAATCGSAPRFAVCSPSPIIGRTIASVGSELGLSVSVLDWDTPQAIRVGVAVPVMGRDLTGASVVSAYLAFGLSF